MIVGRAMLKESGRSVFERGSSPNMCEYELPVSDLRVGYTIEILWLSQGRYGNRLPALPHSSGHLIVVHLDTLGSLTVSPDMKFGQGGKDGVPED
jgi:hypothetical protein